MEMPVCLLEGNGVYLLYTITALLWIRDIMHS